VVQPAASLPYLAKRHGATVVEVNPQKAFADADIHFGDKAGVVLPALLAQVRQLI
jgi:NAD-dependent deacetylase